MNKSANSTSTTEEVLALLDENGTGWCSPYRVSVVANCRPQLVYGYVRTSTGTLGRVARTGDTGKWELPVEVATKWVLAYIAKKS